MFLCSWCPLTRPSSVSLSAEVSHSPECLKGLPNAAGPAVHYAALVVEDLQVFTRHFAASISWPVGNTAMPRPL